MDIFHNGDDWSLRCVTLVPDLSVSQLWRKISIKSRNNNKALVTAPASANVQTRRGTLTLPTLCPAQGRARVLLQPAVTRSPEYHNIK